MKRRAFALFILPFLTLFTGCGSTEAMTFSATLVVSPRATARYETFYSDRYFSFDPFVYHEELALVSHAMTLAAFPYETFKEDYSLQPNNLKSFWKSIGFTDIWCAQNYYEEAETDSIGFAFALKKITDEEGDTATVIAIAIRGNDYGAEWASNVTIGEEGDAQGFREASTSVLIGLKEYIRVRRITGHVKFWTSGFSRAAITANMVAGQIVSNVVDCYDFFQPEVHYTPKDVFAYCFEPPMGVVEDYEIAHTEKFGCIHNLLNFNDLVPLVAPDEWGFTRYGVDHYYPDRLTDIHFDERQREKAVTRYHFTPNGTNLAGYTIDDWTFVDPGEKFSNANGRVLPRACIHPSQARFVRQLIRCLAIDGFHDRFIYDGLAQKGLRRLFAILHGRDEVIHKEDITMEGLLKLFFECNLINVLLMELLDGDVSGFVFDIEPLFYQAFGGHNVSTEDVQAFYWDCLFPLAYFADAFVSHQDILLQLMNIQNLMRIKLAHVPELSYAWLGSCDSRYYGKDANELNDGSYYIFNVASATRISIYEQTFGRVIFESAGKNMSSDILSASYFSDGHTEIYLPKNGKYAYTIEGPDAVGTLIDIDPHLHQKTVRDGMSGSGAF